MLVCFTHRSMQSASQVETNDELGKAMSRAFAAEDALAKLEQESQQLKTRQLQLEQVRAGLGGRAFRARIGFVRYGVWAEGEGAMAKLEQEVQRLKTRQLQLGQVRAGSCRQSVRARIGFVRYGVGAEGEGALAKLEQEVQRLKTRQLQLEQVRGCQRREGMRRRRDGVGAVIATALDEAD